VIPQRPLPASLLLMALHIFRKLCACQRPAFALCDWKDSSHKSGTCDQPVCAWHAKEVLPGKFLCPRHWLEYDRRRRKFSASQLEALFMEAA
jgi:hypothetical protein